MMNKFVMGALSILGVSLSMGTAQSARMPGSSGHQWPNPLCAPGMCGTGAGTACFDHSNAVMENRCPQTIQFTTRLLVIPVSVSSVGNPTTHSFTARIKGNGSFATTCQGLVIDNNNSASGSGSNSTTSTSLTTKILGSASVFSDDVVQVECQVAPQSSGAARGGVLRVNADPV